MDSGDRKHSIGSRWRLKVPSLPSAPLESDTLAGKLGAHSPPTSEGSVTSREI